MCYLFKYRVDSRYLEFCAISNFFPGPFSIYDLLPYKMSRTQLSRIIHYLKPIFWSPGKITVVISNFYPLKLFLCVRTRVFNPMLFQLFFECFFLNHFVRLKINILLNSVTRKISFLLATESVSQPMNQGLIRCPKARYRKQLIKVILCSLDSAKPLSQVSLLTALQLLVSALNEVSQTTIVNCLIRKFETLLTRDKVGKCKQVKVTSYSVKEK